MTGKDSQQVNSKRQLRNYNKSYKGWRIFKYTALKSKGQKANDSNDH